MEKKLRVCDECGTDDEDCVQKCVVCGKDLCSDCGASLNCLDAAEIRLCNTHYQQVKDYIEGLKPKPTTVVEKRLMNYVAFDRAAPWGERRISFSDADALYEHMRRERCGCTKDC